jgi:hypothetical protein
MTSRSTHKRRASSGAVPTSSVGFTTLYVVNPTLEALERGFGGFLSLSANNPPLARRLPLGAPFYEPLEAPR